MLGLLKSSGIDLIYCFLLLNSLMYLELLDQITYRDYIGAFF